MTLKQRYEGALAYWREAMPNPSTELVYNNPFEILVAVILSAQCTDKRVNMVTPALFAAFPTPQAMAAATEENILHYIKSVSYPNSKAHHLQQMAMMLVDEFHGIVPDTMEQLTRLPGVGRKTANVILGVVFNKAAIPVDTHVFRVANRMGLASGKTPLEVEKAQHGTLAAVFQNQYLVSRKGHIGDIAVAFCPVKVRMEVPEQEKQHDDD